MNPAKKMQKNDPLHNLEKHLKNGDTVIAAISGGPDSVFLLDLCLQFRKKHAVKIIVAHVNHKLRGRASDLDEEFVRRLSAKNILTCETSIIKKMPAGNLEESARDFRYSFFEKIRKKHRADWILTAHHRDDNIETILFNLARGSSLNGIRGMQVCTPERHLLRPLLDTGKADILLALKRKKMEYRLDASNRDNKLSRNLMRNKIIPLLNRINSSFGNNLLEFCGDLNLAARFIEGESAAWLRKNSSGGAVPLDKFLALPAAMQTNVIAALYKKTHGSTRNFNKKHLAQLLHTLQKRTSGLKKEFGENNFLTVTKSGVTKKREIKITRAH
jgi:tRNA(Ile)-lysidine synthase